VLVQVTVNAPLIWMKRVQVVSRNLDSYSYSCRCEHGLNLAVLLWCLFLGCV